MVWFPRPRPKHPPPTHNIIGRLVQRGQIPQHQQPHQPQHQADEMTKITTLQRTRMATDGTIHIYTHPTHHQNHTRRKKCSRTFVQGHSGTNKTVLLARSTPGPRPSPQSEIPCGGWREHTGQAQTLNTQFPQKRFLSPNKSSAPKSRRGAVEGFV